MESPLPDAFHADTPLRRSIQQAERRRIAQLLHDTVAQSLTGTYLQAMVITQKLQKNGSEASDDIAQLVDTLHEVVLEMREINRQLTMEEGPSSDAAENN